MKNLFSKLKGIVTSWFEKEVDYSQFAPEYKKNDYSPRDALALAYASQLAYEVKKSESFVKEWLSKWGFTEHVTLNPKIQSLTVDTQCFVASNDERVLIAFNGSESAQDWFGNAKLIQKEGFTPGTKIHGGFKDSLAVVEQELDVLLESFDANTKEIWLTGHSLGGALAVLLAAKLAAKNIPVSGLYTFGTPRVGDKAFADTLDEKLKDTASYRLVVSGDFVPHIPPPFLSPSLNYAHAGERILFLNDGTVSRDPNTDDNSSRSEIDGWGEILKDGIDAWSDHITKRGLAIRELHLLKSKDGYIARIMSLGPHGSGGGVDD